MENGSSKISKILLTRIVEVEVYFKTIIMDCCFQSIQNPYVTL